MDDLVRTMITAETSQDVRSVGLVVGVPCINPIELDLRDRSQAEQNAAAPWPILFFGEGDEPDAETFLPLAPYFNGRVPEPGEADELLRLLQQVRNLIADKWRTRIELAQVLGKYAGAQKYIEACKQRGIAHWLDRPQSTEKYR